MIIKKQNDKAVYSDGEVTEAKMLEIAEKYPEDMAQDYISNSSSYTLNNTFSSVRQNILNWYPFNKNSNILEVGAGMGSITGLLCDKAQHVTAIEMSEARAEVIRARYRNRTNLKVISENINEWNTDEKFDYVVFIGVLEYAAVFSDSRRPYDEFLCNVKNLMKEDGVLLFAIENRFGLKYWLGASEDHLQEPFVGIAGYGDGTPRTFSKKELQLILERVGFINNRFYSVLPDYKFPELIFSEEYSPNYLNLKKLSFTYSKNSKLVADEKQLYKDIIENNTFPFFANSFLIEASAKELKEPHVLHVSAKGEVYKEFRVSTVIDSEGNVYKVPMHKSAETHIHNILENTKYLAKRGVSILPVKMKGNTLCSKKHEGISAQDVFAKALSDDDRKLIYKMIDELERSLLASSDVLEYNINNIILTNGLGNEECDYGPILQKAFIDMTFYNAFWENETLLFFDQEWCFSRVPLKFCLYYAVKSAYQKIDSDTSIKEVELLNYINISEEEVEVYNRLEEYLWSNVLYRQTDFYGQEGYCNRYSDENTLSVCFDSFDKRIHQLEQEEIERKGEVEEHLRTINNQRGHIEQLLESERKYLRDLSAKEQEERRLEVLLKEKNLELTNSRMEFEEELKNKEKVIAQFQLKLQDSQREIQEYKIYVRNKEGHIEQLLEAEREYEREKTSRAYRLALRFRKVSLVLFPVDSKRRFFVHLLGKAIRHPFLMLKMINPRRIKNCMTILKNEGVSSAMHHLKLVEEYERSRTVPVNNENIVIEEVAAEEKHFEDYDKLVFETVNHPDVSIVIPVYNQFDYTYHCLESILKNSGKCKYEVIIANDCSTDLTQRISEIVSGINVITNKKNLRFLLNCNNAAAQARGKYILFLNNDTQVQDNWLQPLITLIESDSKIGMVGSKLVYADGYLQEAGGILWKDASAWNYGHRQNPNDSEFNYVRETDYISGAAIMIRASLWKEIGGFDTRFVPAYCEDSDLAFEVRKHGYKVVYQPQSVVVHFEGVSNGTDLNSGQKKYQVDNQVKFVEKWREELEKNHFENGTNVFLARERSRDRKHVLVIDHYVPQYDKDAGSKTTWMYLKMLVKKGYKITFLGDNFYQHEPYTTELQQMGIFVLYGPKYAEGWKEWLEENIQYFDIFYLNRPHISIKYIDFIKERARGKIIYYGHDLHFLRIQREYEISKDTKLLEESKKWLEQETYLMKQADMSYYPSVIEENAIHEIDPKIPVKAITAYVFEQFEKIAFDMKDRQGLLFVGGFGHGPNLDAVLWFLDKIYPEVYKRTKAPFYIVGSKAPEEITSIKTEGVIVKGFVSEEELQMLYKQCRIAVVPLRYGAGVKGKVVEALYYGIPIVTTSVGAEGINGIEEFTVVKDNANELIEEICAIYDNEKSLKDMSVSNQEYVKKHFSVDAVWNIVKEEFE